MVPRDAMTAGLSPRAHSVIHRATTSQASVCPNAKRAGNAPATKMPPHRKAGCTRPCARRS